MKPLLLFALMTLCLSGWAQTDTVLRQKRMFFPFPMKKKWQLSVGVTSTTLPLDITEEVRFRVPAGDVHLLRKMGKNTYMDGRLSIQVLQNMISLGPRWAKPVSNKLSIGAGADLGYWFGFINTEGIKTRGRGFQGTPSISVGYRFGKQILLTGRAEAMLNFGIKTYAAETEVESEYSFFGGPAFSLILEQPFYKKTSLTLGFRAMYTNFFWQTWTLFEGFDRNIFFPQVIIGLIL